MRSGDHQRIAGLSHLVAWSRHPGASQYRFELYDASSARVHTVVTADTFVVFAPPAGDAPASGHWAVTPLDPNLSRVGPAAVATFYVAP